MNSRPRLNFTSGTIIFHHSPHEQSIFVYSHSGILELKQGLGGWRGALTEKWDAVCAALNTLFSHPPGHSQDPHFSIFSVLKTLFSPPNQKFPEICCSKDSKLAKSSVPKSQIRLNLVHMAIYFYFVKNFSSLGSQSR